MSSNDPIEVLTHAARVARIRLADASRNGAPAAVLISLSRAVNIADARLASEQSAAVAVAGWVH